MPTLSKPSPIAGPFAYNGDKSAIPDASASPGAASYQQGFPPITQLPVTAGGVPPQRSDFNGILNALSQHIFWLQSGGMYDWSASLDYAVPAMVAGADGKMYFARQLSGPNTSAGAKDPTNAGNTTYWQALDFSGLPPIDGKTIVELNGKLAVNTSATPANGRIPVGDATKHIPVGWVQDASTGQKGVVKLNNAVNSTSTTEAATPAAVKAAYDAASSAQTFAGAKAPMPQSAAGVGQWIAGGIGAFSGNTVAVPAGGTWVCLLIGSRHGSGSVVAHCGGLVSGGTHINVTGSSSGANDIGGILWRIA